MAASNTGVGIAPDPLIPSNVTAIGELPGAAIPYTPKIAAIDTTGENRREAGGAMR